MESQGIMICGGDFNQTLNPKMDSSGPRISQPKNTIKKNTRNLIAELGIIDIWSEINPTSKDYTFFSSPYVKNQFFHDV